MTLKERTRLVVDFARVLYVNGQSTDQIEATTRRLGHILGLRANILLRSGGRGG
jgi:uncharacterized membrane protein YjjP (DUF1212 family)